jgi:hypothetical protein
MPAATNTPHYYTVRVGHGKNRKYVRVAIVRKREKHGGQTVAGGTHSYKNGD